VRRAKQEIRESNVRWNRNATQIGNERNYRETKKRQRKKTRKTTRKTTRKRRRKREKGREKAEDRRCRSSEA
jgi:hypothetical protein